jgi:hypothetical protein
MSVSDSSTTVSPKSKKRKIRSDKKTSRKQPAKKRARKTSVGKFSFFEIVLKSFFLIKYQLSFSKKTCSSTENTVI